ncbi:MAG: cation diffusion facilitator family transporter, partial [Candidatus Hodarchaeota archaeon]
MAIDKGLIMDHHKTENPFSDHLFEYRTVEKKRLLLSLLITATVMIVEVIGGLVTNSLALISDAGHMFTHSFAIAVSLIAIMIAGKPPCHHRTFGLYRAEILAAFVNGLFLLLIVITLIYEAILRIIYPLEILAFEMLVIALVGLGVNILSIFILQGSIKNDLNIKGLFYHIIGDTASSIGIVLAAIVIFFTGWSFIDPLVSLFISLIIAIWAFGILKESTRILLEMTPKGLNIEMVTNELKSQFPEIKNLFNVHFWTITPEILVFSTHMKVNN